MMVISLVFIPNPLCSLWVAFSIVSIELGVLGFMTLWRINLVKKPLHTSSSLFQFSIFCQDYNAIF
jgi:hypothetical protein